MTLYIMKTHSVLTAIMCLTMASCEIVKIEADMPMSKTQSIEPSDDASFKVTPVNAGDLLEILYPGREISSIDYVAEGQDTLAYIYNFDKGWIVISGDKRGKPILGQSETGRLKAKGNVQGIDVWLKSSIGGICADSDDAKENIDFWNHVIPKSKRTAAKKTTRGWIDETKYWVLRFDYEEAPTQQTNYVIPHLLNTKWGQGYPWNYKCPIGYDEDDNQVLCPTGCTAVAMAQVIYYMHYFKGKPTGLYHEISCYGFCRDEHSYSYEISRSGFTSNSPRWDQMARNRNESSTEYVGDLMMDVGYNVGMTYSGSGSGAFPSSEGFSNYSLSCKKDDYSVYKINSNLSSGVPVIIVAYAGKKKNGIWPFRHEVGTDGHTWVIDGKVEQETFYKKHYYWTLTDTVLDTDSNIYPEEEKEYYIPDVYEGMPVIESRSEIDTYYLMNWGYDGMWDNGFYTLASDSKWYANNLYFQYYKTIYYDIQ